MYLAPCHDNCVHSSLYIDRQLVREVHNRPLSHRWLWPCSSAWTTCTSNNSIAIEGASVTLPQCRATMPFFVCLSRQSPFKFQIRQAVQLQLVRQQALREVHNRPPNHSWLWSCPPACITSCACTSVVTRVFSRHSAAILSFACPPR